MSYEEHLTFEKQLEIVEEIKERVEKLDTFYKNEILELMEETETGLHRGIFLRDRKIRREKKFGFSCEYGFEDFVEYDGEDLYRVTLMNLRDIFNKDFLKNFDGLFVSMVRPNKMYEELKTHNPCFVNELYNTLYFTEENAKEIHDMIPSFLKKYEEKLLLTQRNRKARNAKKIALELGLSSYGEGEDFSYDIEGD